jgi:CheY-like chemotaxis protein
VLVAEDNRVNQLVISRLLEKLNHRPVLCANGYEAVAAVEAQTWDLVLMDIQMPEMDGLAATAAIRRREADWPGSQRLPIVALTALAMKADRERCLAAGMDDYLAKPVRRDELMAVLTRLCPDGRTDPDERESAADTRAESSGWNVSAGLAHADGDRELLSELLAIFVEDGPGHLRGLSAAIALGDADKVMRAAHTLKGELRTLGAAAPASRAEQLEALGQSGRLEDATTLLAPLTSEVHQVLAAATRALNASPGPRAASVQGSR